MIQQDEQKLGRELCTAMYGIANATVLHSSGLGLGRFDARQIREDVACADKYVELARTYADAQNDLINARGRVRAAETLGQDPEPYRREEQSTNKLIGNLIDAMLNVVGNSKFQKDMYGRWTPRQ